MRLCCVLLAVTLVGCAEAPASRTDRPDDAFDRWSDGEWQQPSKAYRPMVRWWWPGGAVTEDGIAAELALLDDQGFGGVEIQAFTFGLPEPRATSPQVMSVGTPEFARRISVALAHARRRGMRADLTMSSGWGLGGPVDCAACGTHQLLMTEIDVAGPGEIDRVLPRPTDTPYHNDMVPNVLGLVGDFDQNLELVAVVRGRLRGRALARNATTMLDELVDITASASNGRVKAVLPPGRFRLFALYRNLSNTRLVGAAYPGNPKTFRTIDHLDARGLHAFQRGFFNPFTRALSERPNHYFVDSFEILADLPWTPSFRDHFRKRRGYDVMPYVPLLFWKGGDFFFESRTAHRADLDGVTERVREDYVDVRAHLFEEQFLTPLREMTHATGARLRLQALGGYGDYLDVLAAVDVPEAEDFGLEGASEFLRLASSAAHVSGRRWASNEAFVGISTSSTALLDDDFLRMAGRAFASGINQLVASGRAYPTDGWYPFDLFNITSRLDTTHPVWPRLAGLNTTLARMTYAMSRGEASTQVAWLVTEPRPSEFDKEFPVDGPAEAIAEGPYREVSAVTRVLRTHAMTYDRVSRSLLATSGRPCNGRACIGAGRYSLVLVDSAAVASEDWLARLLDFAAADIPVVIVGQEPARARGFTDAGARDRRVRDMMTRLSQRPSYRHVATAGALGPILQKISAGRSIRPIDAATWQLATYERALPSEQVVLLFNGTDAEQVAAFEVLRDDVRELIVLDPEGQAAVQRIVHPGTGSVQIRVPAGRSRIVRLLTRAAEGAT